MKRIDVVYALITNEDNTQVLMVKNRESEAWTLPGGTVERLETLEAAMIREAKEETGYDIKVYGIIAVNEAKLKSSDEHAIFFTFRGEIDGGREGIYRPEEITDVQWIELKQADELMPYYKEGISGLVEANKEIIYYNEGDV